MIKKRFQTHHAPTTFQTQEIQENSSEETNDDKLDQMTFDIFEMFFVQILQTMKSIHSFLSSKPSSDQSMDVDDDDTDILIDRDQSRDLASRAFYYALDSFYFLLSLFKIKQIQWQKELDRDSTCFHRLIEMMIQNLFTKKLPNNVNERTEILKKFFSFTDILNLVDITRLCQALELFIQLFEEETHQVTIESR